eukprot:88576_1
MDNVDQQEAIKELVAAGFTKKQALAALEISQNNDMDQPLDSLEHESIQKVECSTDSTRSQYCISNRHTSHTAVISGMIALMRESGISANEAKKAVVMSMDSEAEQVSIDRLDLEMIVECFMENGFGFEESMNALTTAGYNIGSSLEILIYHTNPTPSPSPQDPFNDKRFNFAVKGLINTGETERLATVIATRHWNQYKIDRGYERLLEELIALGNDRQTALRYLRDIMCDKLAKTGGYDLEATRQALKSTNWNLNDAQDILDGITSGYEAMKERLCGDLIAMGFSKAKSIEALKMAKFDVHDAAVILLSGVLPDTKENDDNLIDSEGDCDGGSGSMNKCQYLTFLKGELEKYYLNSIQHGSESSDFVAKVLNCFHHLIQTHDSHNEFEDIYTALGGRCDISHCDKMQRNRRDRTKSVIGGVSFVRDIMDKIHCRFRHSYDMGYRLTKAERKQIEQLQETGDDAKSDHIEDMFNISSLDSALIEMHKVIVSKKQQINKQFVNNHTFNKFSTIAINKGNYETFSNGERYVYWDRFRQDEANNRFYVYPKYESLKEELTKNRRASVTMDQWSLEYQKADTHRQSHVAKKLIANPETAVDTHWVQSPHPMRNGLALEIAKGEKVKTHHLVALLVYCNYTVLSYEFSKTYRRMDNDDLNDDDYKQYVADETCTELLRTNNESNWSMKARHSSFYHLARYLNELIHVFSPRAMDADPFRATFYHGVNQKMKFITLRDNMYQPFSTTTSYEVAVRFSISGIDAGMVLELSADGWSRYFDCQCYSDFPGERELLFINSIGPFKFVNLTDTQSGRSYDVFVKALGIVDAMIVANPFQPDDRVVTNSKTEKNWIKKLDLRLQGAVPIDPMLKVVTLQLIKHELHRYQPQKYKKMENVDGYIEELFHFVCTMTKAVHINWKLMSVEITDKYERGGYNGYLFLRTLFCVEDLEMIDLDFICLLFPHLIGIRLSGCDSIKKDCFDYILQFLTKQFAKDLAELSIECHSEHDAFLMTKYSVAFGKIGWILQKSGNGFDGQYVINVRNKNFNFKSNDI